MRRNFLRSLLFSIGFYAWTGFGCIIFIPGFILPRKHFTSIVHIWLKGIEFLETAVMDLRYEVRGREYLPTQGAYIIAAKHQSAYETFKLRLLFDDPAIVLKKELIQIPIWGMYLKKSGVIALDRSTREKALRSLEEGAQKIAAEGRPIVIFPQGTRVRPTETPAQKPYKPGIARVQTVTNLPVIPMALNSGMYWPKGSIFKSAGTVVFEFLPPIMPGEERRDFMQTLEKNLEGASQALMNEARAIEINSTGSSKSAFLWLAIIIALVSGYSWAWFEAADEIRRSYISFMQDAAEMRRTHSEPVITGFPGPMIVRIAEDTLMNNEGSLKIENIELHGWPIPLLPIHLSSGTITIRSYKWASPIILDRMDARISYFNQHLSINKANIYKADFQGMAEGKIDLTREPIPAFDLTIRMNNHPAFLAYLATEGVIEERQALLMGAGFNIFRNKDGIVEVPITQRGQTVYAGPLAIAEIPLPANPVTFREEMAVPPALAP